MSSARIVLISAIASGQGKTTVTAALARKLIKQGLRVRVFKTGPDYLDPMILQRASGAEVYALDLWMVGLDDCRRLLAKAAAEVDVILIEGVMGLYDGNPCSADLARAFGVPVVVVLDAAKMAQTVGAIVLGLQQYGPVEMAGVIVNRVASASHATQITQGIRDIRLLATMPKLQASLPERHLGLVQPDEIAEVDQILDQLADQIDLDMNAWNSIPPIMLEQSLAAAQTQPTAQLLAGKNIAIARDAAFAFVYHANLECLRAAGAQLHFFSPLNDEPVPADADAVYIPGGYPELHCASLSGAQRWQNSMRDAYAKDVPILAECGGMMVVAETLKDAQGKVWPMVGLLKGEVVMQTKLAGLGMQALETLDGELRGHAFHYSTLITDAEPIAQTVKRSNGAQGEAVYKQRALTATYFHAYFSSCPAAMARIFSKDELS
ncbi:cobyrinate a,c-diamide synthase [Herminiimonas aquatilis]|uniref:Cobyrinate a,c-diamide synthase n=1 Tax=Herminiimonas aquatilis TaxID=345342 RepID=A0ABW2J9C2_9BURK